MILRSLIFSEPYYRRKLITWCHLVEYLNRRGLLRKTTMKSFQKKAEHQVNQRITKNHQESPRITRNDDKKDRHLNRSLEIRDIARHRKSVTPWKSKALLKLVTSDVNDNSTIATARQEEGLHRRHREDVPIWPNFQRTGLWFHFIPITTHYFMAVQSG